MQTPARPTDPAGRRAMNNRQKLASLCDRIGATRLALTLRRHIQSPWLPILTFHRVAERPGLRLLDDYVVNSAPNAFDQQMEWVQQYFTPVGIDELVRFTEGHPLPR